ncbi:PREDICTED: uveal autoantigen with coiled-coil domains and ankyrin repeats-like [Tinamus guttatus]|uniref:uveal autoantigen with coiled-coil domains and ankyrin repeats-like n=1 Tax=Tinamus guttatus TaxID=94827 RepID=UPI00052E96A8|nr:PREDICTED: uveal autoantigen with coiled-coil domains and ankyrin repeats-like [Tinamus guttatus]
MGILEDQPTRRCQGMGVPGSRAHRGAQRLPRNGPTTVLLFLPDVLVLLMTDVLIFLQEKDQKYTFPMLKPAVISLQNLIVRDIANQEKGMFLISAAPPEMYEVHAASRDDRNNWMKVIQQTVSLCPSRQDFPLIETEIEASLRKLKGSTALHLATIACQPQCVKVLLQIQRLLAQTEQLSAEVLALRGERTRLRLRLQVGARRPRSGIAPGALIAPVSPCRHRSRVPPSGITLVQHKTHRDVVAVYRTHLLQAAQGFMDEAVHAVLLQILRAGQA